LGFSKNEPIRAIIKSSSKLRIVHIVAGLWKDTGGPAEVIPNLCRAQVKAGAEVILCSIDGDNAPQVVALKGSGVDVHLFPALDGIIRWSPELARFLNSLHKIDVIHNHGHWLWPNWYASNAARRLNALLVTTPHGTLVPGMLASSSLKKRTAWAIFDRHLIARADVIHALSSVELHAMSVKLGSHASKARILPNGVHPGHSAGHFTADDSGVLLFLSRVSSIKGVIPLLKAWQNLELRFPKWSLRIVGPIAREIANEVEQLCYASERAAFVGPVYENMRWDEYRAASAFVLPTRGEGLPTVLLEAAAHKLPIITTPEANFKELFEAGGSIMTAVTPAEIEAVLSNFFNLPGEDRRTIGLRGRTLMEKHFTWNAIADQWLSIYVSAINEKTRGHK
jgi:glycosyltransferase involved in cell wall biosynthesis